jgi:hypothetical protein
MEVGFSKMKEEISGEMREIKDLLMSINENP